jgi:hypothetical protein
MALHLFRPADPPDGYLSPSWRAWRGLLYVAGGRLLNWAAAFASQPRVRRTLHACLIVLGLAVQGMMLLTAAYLIDLAVSLMELWTELARKHLELTL